METGIQVCIEASEDIRVGLDSSPPCWNDAIEGLLELSEISPLYFSRESDGKTRNLLDGSQQ
jgi:hypothetical protein